MRLIDTDELNVAFESLIEYADKNPIEKVCVSRGRRVCLWRYARRRRKGRIYRKMQSTHKGAGPEASAL